MGTKLKNIKYSMVTKVFAVILAWLSFLTVCGSGLYIKINSEISLSSNYYDTYKFMEEYSRLIHNTVEYYIKLKSEENIRVTGVSELDIQNKLNRYNIIKTRLSEQVNFAYYIRNVSTGEVITNRNSDDEITLIKKQESMAHFWQNEFEYKYSLMNFDDIRKILEGTSYEVYTAVLEPMKEGDILYDNYIAYLKAKKVTNDMTALLIISLILMLSALAYLVFAAGRKEGMDEVVLKQIDRIYLDVHTLLVFIAAMLSFWAADITLHSFNMTEFIVVSIILNIDFFMGLSYLLSVSRQLKTKRFKDNLLLYKTYRKAVFFNKLMLEGKIFKAWILALLVGYSTINSILFALTYLALINNDRLTLFIASALLVTFNIAALYFAARALKSLAQIMEDTKEISAGNLDYKIDSSKMSFVFSAFAENIQSIQGGLRNAVAEAIKGERMKTDLITNVSHDLKTPLTSIINYVGLLKKEEIENKQAREYIDVLDEKSERLKVLIEDLIEASKASSGNLPVNIQKVDLHELVMQAFGEYREKFEKAGLDIRISTTDKNIFVQADGKHMWRLIENLLSNVLKYSMKHSRVYISITKNEAYGVLTIKNISAMPLEIPVDQLTERFVRGDEARTTEGSGLGLAIAQSLINIQNGRFNIEIDGDLFKATVEMPIPKDL